MSASSRAISALWRKVEAPGYDSCQVAQRDGGWSVVGTAVFLEGADIAHLRYDVTCDAAWRSKQATVEGWLGERRVALRVTTDGQGRWEVNGQAVPAVSGCVDVDLNFTPATNLIQLRRLNLAIGARVKAPAAWLAFPEFELRVLPQTLARATAELYEYEAPTVGYTGVLRVHETGVVLDYPQLWHAEAVQRLDGP